MVDYLTRARTHARKHKHTHTHMRAACSFLRIISLWSVSAWLSKAHFLPSVYSLQDHTKHTQSVGHTLSRHMHNQSRVIGVLFPLSRSPRPPACQGVFLQFQTATLNSFRSIFNGCPKPRTLTAPIRSAILAEKCRNLQFLSLPLLAPPPNPSIPFSTLKL